MTVGGLTLDDITNAGAKLSFTPERCERIAHWTSHDATMCSGGRRIRGGFWSTYIS